MKYYGLIDYQYLFSTHSEYKKKKYLIAKAFARWTAQEIVIYRMYVFSRPLLRDKQKTCVWEEINELGSIEYKKRMEHESSDKQGNTESAEL